MTPGKVHSRCVGVEIIAGTSDVERRTVTEPVSVSIR
jgi:hypothetical protein